MKNKQIIFGDVFPTNEGGSVTVVEYRGAFEVVIKHDDSYEHIATVTARHLRSGGVRNPYRPSVYGIGFMGAGEHVSKVDGKHTSEYTAWGGYV